MSQTQRPRRSRTPQRILSKLHYGWTTSSINTPPISPSVPHQQLHPTQRNMSSTSSQITSPTTSPTTTNTPLPISPPPNFSVDLEVTEGGTLEPIHRQRMPVAAFNATDEPNGNQYIMMAYQATIIGATREFHRLSTRSAMRITCYLPYLLPDQATVTHFHWAVEHAMDVLKAVNMWNFPLQEVL
jgi:hypothetical protein